VANVVCFSLGAPLALLFALPFALDLALVLDLALALDLGVVLLGERAEEEGADGEAEEDVEVEPEDEEVGEAERMGLDDVSERRAFFLAPLSCSVPLLLPRLLRRLELILLDLLS